MVKRMCDEKNVWYIECVMKRMCDEKNILNQKEKKKGGGDDSDS